MPYPQTATIITPPSSDDRRFNRAYRRLLSRKAVLDLMSFSNSVLYQLIADGFFPKPVKPTGGRASAWIEDEVLDFIEARIRDRDAEVSKASKSVSRQADSI